MLKLRTKKSKDHAASNKLPAGEDIYHYHVEQVFLGHHTIFTLLGLAIGADLFARTIYDFLQGNLHPGLILFIGFIIFVLSGLMVGSFND